MECTHELKYNYFITAKEYWYDQAKLSLQDALNLQTLNKNVAKNLVLFLGDGMSISTVTAARILKGQNNLQPGEEGLLSWETFPHAGLSKVSVLFTCFLFITNTCRPGAPVWLNI